MALTEDRFLQLMEKINESQCRKIEERVSEQLNTVKSELTVAINKVSERQDSMEEEQKGMKNTMSAMQRQLDSLSREKAEPDRPTTANVATFATVVASSKETSGRILSGCDAGDPKVADIIDHARRTVGLYKIDSDDLKRMRLSHFGGAKTEEEEMTLAVKEFLKCELKIGQDDIEDMLIENIFIPAKDRGDPQSLNVTFRSVKSVTKIFEKTKIMRRESRIVNYIPRQFQDRLAAVSTIDYNLRADKQFQTRIKMGLNDIELHKKLRGTSRWEKVILPPDLPPVDLSAKPPAQESGSPPPGRPGHDYTRDNKRGRESTGSDSSQNDTKVAKKSHDTANNIDVTKQAEKDQKKDEESDESFEKLVEKADLVSQGETSSDDGIGKKPNDPGIITSVQGTPKHLCLEKLQQSPIFSKSGKKNLNI